ncbi:MAG: cupin domain-containing protein [Desulfococcaceae bacterium]
MQNFIYPPNHTGFKALVLSGQIDESVKDCAIAYIEPNGGGPNPDHTHAHDHIFTVISGSITVRMPNQEATVRQGESIHVPGNLLHSVWNKSDTEAKVIGISIFHPPLPLPQGREDRHQRI